MIYFEVPKRLTYWDNSFHNGGIKMTQELRSWLLTNQMVIVENIYTDNSRAIFDTKYIMIGFKKTSDAMLFKLTWM